MATEESRLEAIGEWLKKMEALLRGKDDQRRELESSWESRKSAAMKSEGEST